MECSRWTIGRKLLARSEYGEASTVEHAHDREFGSHPKSLHWRDSWRKLDPLSVQWPHLEEETVPGPTESFEYWDGLFANLYLVRFDKQGRLLSPETAQAFLDEAAVSTDIFVFSHGWNNTYSRALERYRTFINQYIGQARTLGIEPAADYHPVLLGIIWPSTSFVFPWESGPVIAGESGLAEREYDEMLEFVAESLEPNEVSTFTEALDAREDVDIDQATTLAEIVRAALMSDTDPDTGGEPPSVENLLTAWQAIDELGGSESTPTDPDVVGAVPDGPDGASSRPPVAAGISLFDPRSLLRTATVWKMKKRAGVVGVNGLGPLLERILSSSNGRVHLAGHSFGARVVLSALATDGLAGRHVQSVLLLQPAINRWCFAPNIPGIEQPGGYNRVLNRVTKPIVTTFSSSDAPLHDFFHLAIRTLGEVEIASVGDTDRFGALGGYGPAGVGDVHSSTTALKPPSAYSAQAGCEVLSVDGSRRDGQPALITNHGDVTTPVTAWMLRFLTS